METVWIVGIVVAAVAILVVSIVYRGRLTEMVVKFGKGEFGLKAKPDNSEGSDAPIGGVVARDNKMKASTITAPKDADATVTGNEMEDGSVIEIRDASTGVDERGG